VKRPVTEPKKRPEKKLQIKKVNPVGNSMFSSDPNTGHIKKGGALNVHAQDIKNETPAEKKKREKEEAEKDKNCLLLRGDSKDELLKKKKFLEGEDAKDFANAFTSKKAPKINELFRSALLKKMRD